MTDRIVRIKDLDSIRITLPGQDPLEIALGGRRIGILAEVAGRRVDLASLVESTFYGQEAGEIDGIQEVELRFAGDAPVVVRRHFLNGTCSLRIAGRIVDLGEQTPGQHLFGLPRSAASRALRVDGRKSLADAVEHGVAGALQRDLAVLAGLEDACEVQNRITALDRRIESIRNGIESMPAPPETSFRASDPPALGNLIKAIEETREVERRLLGRRIELAGKLEGLSKGEAKIAGATSQTLIDSLDSSASALEKIEKEIASLAAKAAAGGAQSIITVTVVIVIAVCGLALMGRELGDDLMFRGGLAAAGAALIGGVGAGLIRAQSIISATKKVKDLRQEKEDTSKKALGTCRRVGAPADLGDVTPDTLRRIADRARGRNVSQEIRSSVGPLIDTPAELDMVRKLAEALERPITESKDPSAPTAPVIRASAAVVDLATQWVEHVDETARSIEAAGRDRVVYETERELLNQSLAHLEKERDDLATQQQSHVALAESSRNLARRLDREVVPILRRILGVDAPVGFTTELVPMGRVRGEPAEDAVILTVARLVLHEGLGTPGLRIASDLTCGLDDDVAARLLEWCLTAPDAGRFVLAPRRHADELAIARHARDIACSHATVIEATPVSTHATAAPEAGAAPEIPVHAKA